MRGTDGKMLAADTAPPPSSFPLASLLRRRPTSPLPPDRQVHAAADVSLLDLLRIAVQRLLRADARPLRLSLEEGGGRRAHRLARAHRRRRHLRLRPRPRLAPLSERAHVCELVQDEAVDHRGGAADAARADVLAPQRAALPRRTHRLVRVCAAGAAGARRPTRAAALFAHPSPTPHPHKHSSSSCSRSSATSSSASSTSGASTGSPTARWRRR